MAYKGSVIVTGGTVGLGYEAALKIAKDRPDYLVVVASRSDKQHAADSINRALGQSNVRFQALDLADPDNVRRFAMAWSSNTQNPPIKAVVLNAALQFPNDLTLTPSGIEKTFAVTHLGHAQLFHLLAPSLAPDARIVITASGVHDPAQKSGMPDAVYTTAQEVAGGYPGAVKGRARYCNAKLCNVLWTYALHRRLEAHNKQHPDASWTVTAMDPGLMPGTGLAREGTAIERFLWFRVLPRVLPLLRLLMGMDNIHHPSVSGANLARLAVGEDVRGVSGKYFEGAKEIDSSKVSYDVAKQEDLWQWTVKFCAGEDEELLKRFEALQ
ncbi:uncharacterized protein B0I36DRAFT_255715 [Microdochium trichocladiopsis]|uniref:Short-chain dehydrogenase n=1 Tax=Microdochium trichocladiopsis TaxID=1682393 RepID=A0A9P9BI84_9PEZI|nr:uncharacterized protein B0I36DRAFT_255715 [Microdochium trichocladiopsis]KAH7014148.1 hypothetical protein B0I36DRAFT_255715 [Microdochium trichocladiopsis]